MREKQQIYQGASPSLMLRCPSLSLLPSDCCPLVVVGGWRRWCLARVKLGEYVTLPPQYALGERREFPCISFRVSAVRAEDLTAAHANAEDRDTARTSCPSRNNSHADNLKLPYVLLLSLWAVLLSYLLLSLLPRPFFASPRSRFFTPFFEPRQNRYFA